jgi:hypothetical protein
MLVGRIGALEQRVQAIDGTVEKLAASPVGGDTSALTERLSNLERLTTQLATLDQKVRDIEGQATSTRQGMVNSATTVLAVMQLAQAVDGGLPFERPLAAVKRGVAGDVAASAAAASLEPFAREGVPTLAALRANFPGVADAVARAAPAAAMPSWYERTISRLKILVGIRVTGPEAERVGGDDALLARAETSLAGGDLKTAVAMLDGIRAPDPPAATTWVSQARGRLAADQALQILDQQALARLTAETE